jgi:hypothetical protein
MHILSVMIILLAYSQLEGLEGKALQREIFLLLLLPAKLAKAATKEIFSGACSPRSPRWRLASGINDMEEHKHA